MNKYTTNKKISSGVAHKVPADLRKILSVDSSALAAWEDITPLARNEWICWVTFVKKSETRKLHVKRTITELKEGKRRPCCWMGCPHRGLQKAPDIKNKRPVSTRRRDEADKK